MRISDWSSDVCSSDLRRAIGRGCGAVRLGNVRAAQPARRRHLDRAADIRGQHPAAARADLATIAAALPSRHRADLCHRRGHMQQPGKSRRCASYRSGEAETTAPYLFARSEEHTSELQSLMRISYAVFCLKKKIKTKNTQKNNQ